jgi:hypothetical protein
MPAGILEGPTWFVLTDSSGLALGMIKIRCSILFQFWFLLNTGIIISNQTEKESIKSEQK